MSDQALNHPRDLGRLLNELLGLRSLDKTGLDADIELRAQFTARALGDPGKRENSLGESRSYPSAILDGTDRA